MRRGAALRGRPRNLISRRTEPKQREIAAGPGCINVAVSMLLTPLGLWLFRNFFS